jgi:hypothetical protein
MRLKVKIKIRVSMILAAFVLFLGGCSHQEPRQAGNFNTNLQADVQTPNGGPIIEDDLYALADADLSARVDSMIRKIDLRSLVKGDLKGGFELRLWTNLGSLKEPRLFGIRSDSRQKRAYFYVFSGAADVIKESVENVANPASGWNKMVFEVRSRLTTPQGLRRDPNFSLARDEPVMMLEVVENGDYRRIFYGQNTSFPDGKRLMAMCDYLSSEFPIDMDIGH